MAHDLVVIGRGRLIEQSPVPDFIARHTRTWVHVRGPDLTTLVEQLHRRGAKVRYTSTDAGPADAGDRDRRGVDVFGVPVEAVGELAAEHAIVLHELTVRAESLEEAFLAATAAEQEFRAAGAEGRPS